MIVAVNGTAKEVNGAVVSSNYFSLLGLQPALGRFFHAGEDSVPDRDRVVVIGHDFWQVWFDGAPAAIGSALEDPGRRLCRTWHFLEVTRIAPHSVSRDR